MAQEMVNRTDPGSDTIRDAFGKTNDNFTELYAKMTEFISVKDFGAIGDGVANDTGAFASALAAGSAAGRMIFVPPGTYVLDNLSIPSNSILFGSGEGSVLKLLSTSVLKRIMNIASGISAVKVQHLKLDLNAVANSVGVDIEGTDVTVAGCNAIGGGTSAVYLRGAFERVLITGNHFGAVGRGVLTENSATGKRVTISNNFFDQCTRDGVMLNTPTGSAYGFVVSGNHFYKIANADVVNTGIGVGSDGTSDIVISDNFFEYTLFEDIHLEDAVKRVVISNNISKFCGVVRDGITMSRASLDSIEILTSTAASTDVTIIGNQIFQPARYGIYIGPSAQSWRNLQIISNRVDAPGSAGIITGSLAHRVLILGNIVTDAVGPGIDVHGQSTANYQSIVVGNQSYDAGRGLQTYGLKLSTTNSLHLGLNHFSGTTGAIQDGAGNTNSRRVRLDAVSADRGDASVTLDTTSAPVQRFATALTANRTVTLPSTAGEYWRDLYFRIVRTGLGAFTLDVGGLKTMPASTPAFVEVVHDGTAWRLVGYGTL